MNYSIIFRNNFHKVTSKFINGYFNTQIKKVNQMIQQHGFYVANADITIVAQRPKLLPYIENMAENIRKILSLPENTVNVKATTTEHLGFVGRMEGISSYAICTVEEKRG